MTGEENETTYLLGEFCLECEADNVPSGRGLPEISVAGTKTMGSVND